MGQAAVTRFGRTRIIANPQAQAGNGAAAAKRLQRFLSLYLRGRAAGDSFELRLTEYPSHATELAAAAGAFDTVCALGGDGVIHEVVNGLMRLAPSARPALALVPIGSGNDYARTLGYTTWDGRDFSFLLNLAPQRVDVGRVTLLDADAGPAPRFSTGEKNAHEGPAAHVSPAGEKRADVGNLAKKGASEQRTNGTTSAEGLAVTKASAKGLVVEGDFAKESEAGVSEKEQNAGEKDVLERRPGVRTVYFAETLAFGLDAAIGLGVGELKGAVPFTGAALYLASGLKAFGHDYRMFPARVSFDGEPAQRLTPIFFAMQNGPTYGSGFHICPGADPSDGLLDVCYAEGPYPRVPALGLFLSAKNGKHVRSKRMRFRRVRRIELAFEGAYPIEADGERLHARHIAVDLVSQALTVLRPV